MDAAAIFERERPQLTRIAYRMLGSVDDAEDVVQRAFMRFAAAELSVIAVPEAWLTRTVSRLALDALRVAKRRREVYVGQWLPEPPPDPDVVDEAMLDAALMLALERLSPLERAAFLLHDVFGVGFEEVGATLGREVAACRQLAARARKHVREARPRMDVAPQRHEALALAFHAAARTGDLAALGTLLAEDVVMTIDGGGKRAAALRRLVGRDDVTALFAGVLSRYGPAELAPTFRILDGLPCIVTREVDGHLQTTTLVVDGGLVTAILMQRNPDKLARLDAAGSAGHGQGTGSP